MRNRKHGLKAIVLAAMVSVLGTMAFAASAQAQLPGDSLAGTYLINLSEALLATLVGTGGLGSLLVPGRNLKLECHEAHLEGAKIDSLTDALGKVTFLECESLDLEKGTELPCETVVLKTISAEALALPILHGPKKDEPETKEPFVLFEPPAGKTNFTTVSYKEGTECPLPLNNPVTGSISALVHELDAVQQLLLFSPDIQLLTGDVLRYGGFVSYIHGDVTVELAGDAGKHKGLKLGIH